MEVLNNSCKNILPCSLLLALSTVAVTGPVAAQSDAVPAAEGRLEEIVVTAQKEQRNLQEVAAALTAIDTGSLLAGGITDLRAAQMLAPAARFQAEGNNTQVFIRGVGASLDLPNVEPSVAFVFGGSYVPREGTSAAFFDIAQVEVLPGPQGTLYGRSAIGGTVVVTPSLPANDTAGRTLFEAGNFSTAHATYAQNIPITDGLALRAALDYYHDDGINESGGDARSDLGARLSALYEPNDALSFLVWSQWSEKNGHPANLVNKGTDPVTLSYREDAFLHPDDPWDDTRSGSLAPLAPFGEPQADHQHYEMFMTGGELNWRLGGVRLTWLPSYFYLDSAPDYWLGAIRARLTAHYNQVASEIRLASDGHERVDWLGGLYLYRVRNDGELILFTNQPFAFRQSNISFNQIESVAAFGQITVRAAERLRFTVGGRYSLDDREAQGFAPDPVGTGPFTFDEEFTHFDWKLGAEYDVSTESLLYATIQTGYKPGTYNEVPSTPTFDNLVKSSELLAYTAGYKTRLRDDTLQINTEIFYYDYSDLAIQAYDIAAPFNPVFNAEKVEIYGTQIDAVCAVASHARINLNVGYTRARNEKFTTPAGDDYSGLQPPYAPDWTVLAGYEQGFRAGGAELVARVDARWESSWFADYVHNPGVKQAGSWKADVSLTYESRGAWTLGAWIKNITDEPVIAATAAAGIPGPATAYLEPPRSYGLRATIEF